MKVLHLFSNHKWTGPAEPAVNLCLALRERGVEADFACNAGNRDTVNPIAETARDRGIEPITHLALPKHRRPLKNALGARGLRALLRRRRYDLLHCHLDNDHRIALGPARKEAIPIVRSSYEGEGFRRPRQQARLLRGTRFLIEASNRALEHDAGCYRFPRERMRVIPGAIDTERFDPTREVPDGRSWLHIPRDAFVIGIVARMQSHRHFHDLWETARRLLNDNDKIHVIVVGRGTDQESIGKGPVRELGLQANVHFSGYVQGENYVGILKALDVSLFLVPGSDGTCRAVREAMAMAKPVVVSDRGMLPEIVHHEKNGYVTDGSPQELHPALLRLSRDRRLTHTLGAAARQKAQTTFSLETQAAAVLHVYQSIL